MVALRQRRAVHPTVSVTFNFRFAEPLAADRPSRTPSTRITDQQRTEQTSLLLDLLADLPASARSPGPWHPVRPCRSVARRIASQDG
jgi:hypothetical protein